MKPINWSDVSHATTTRSKPSALRWWRRWPEWARYAAIVWSLFYGALGFYWTLGGSGFPLGLLNDPIAQYSAFRHVTASTAGPVIAILSFLGATTLFMFKFNTRGITRTILLLYAWSAATILCFAIPDTRALIGVAYAPISLIAVLFGQSLHYIDFFTWPVINQYICLIGGLLWAATALSFQRQTCNSCAYCGRKGDASRWMVSRSTERWGRWVTYVAIFSPAYYDVTRIAWLLGIPLGITKELYQSLQDSGAVWAGAGLSLVSIGGAILTHGLIKPWGETFPRGFPFWAGKRVPAAAAVVPAGFVSILLTVSGIQVFFQFLWSSDFDNWGATTPLLLMPIWGIALGIATIFFYYRRQEYCNHCSR
ncbi:hypothetical protein DVH26_10475 [Paenibacillus sp. H1-7]|uniref:hypothetical protein n=1 Tax=Paenibacillus sp. H1-7 TaxID=2282849 RepID=UPI001EF7CB64|nr:hypothetical protein [Paenibacillus sp. H1-7]ULL14833.1 hypothetical protein DVH26_10475 [Paenibacillus sp. H1-7]